MKILTVKDELFHADRTKYKHMKKQIIGFRNVSNDPQNATVGGGGQSPLHNTKTTKK
jgi:hypothetical protein